MKVVNREVVAGAVAAVAVAALVPVYQPVAVALLVVILGVAALSVVGYERTTFGLVAVGVGLVTFNAVRPVSGATLSDIIFAVAVIVIVVGLLDSTRSFTGLPDWLWATAGLFALAAGLAELFPASPSQAALYFPGGVYSRFPIANQPLSSLGALIRLEMALLLVPFVITQVATDWRRIRQLADVWLAGVVVGSLLGVAVYLGLTHLPSLVGGDPNVGVTRIKGLSVHPNVFGNAAAMVLPIAAVLYGLAAGRQRLYYGIAMAVLIVGIAVSGSRAAILGGVFGLCVLVVMDPASRTSLRRVALGLIMGVLVGGFTTFGGLPGVSRLLGSSDAVASDQARWAVYSRVWAEIEHRPIIGHDFQYLRGSHNIYMQVLHAGGIVALAALVMLLVGVLRVGLHTTGSGPQRGLTRALLASAVVWLLVGGLFGPAIFDRYLYIPIGLLVATWSVAAKGSHAEIESDQTDVG